MLPAGTGFEIIRTAATATKGMIPDEVNSLEFVHGNVRPLNGAWASCRLSISTGDVVPLVRRFLHFVAGLCPWPGSSNFHRAIENWELRGKAE